MKSNRTITTSLLLLLTAGLIFSCTRATNPDIERGSSYFFQDGHPELRLSALGILNEEDEGVINVVADIVEGSLIYRERNGKNVAEVDIEIRIVGREGTGYSDSYTTSMQVDNEQEGFVTTQNVVKYKKDMKVPPGNYEVQVSVTDKSSGNHTTRSTQTFIPDPAGDEINLTSVQLLGKSAERSGGQYLPITTYDVSTAKDSIRFVVQVTNNRSEDPLTVHSQLKRFESDTTPARPMSFNNYSPSSLPYKGIDYSNSIVKEETRRVLEQPGSVLIEYRYPLPDRGNYRFEVRTEGADAEELFKARDFSIKSENYPAIKNPRELAEPLAYLMGRRDYERLMEIEDPDSLKEAIDRFWLENVGSMNRARSVISLYYERVEQANKQFSNFKEGWKTDQGMIMALFGSPDAVFSDGEIEEWIYERRGTMSRIKFNFTKVKNIFTNNHYELVRNPSYDREWYRTVDQWRKGRQEI
jgi:GWxTD domain-containing protein